VKNNIQN